MALRQNRLATLTDVNFMQKMSNCLSFDHALTKRLAGTLFNGFDFNEQRLAQLKKLDTVKSFFTHSLSVNKRVACFEHRLENLSMHQI